MFGRATITLGIGPHSSLSLSLSVFAMMTAPRLLPLPELGRGNVSVPFLFA